ncbi:hypothetical protein Godav_018877, partial [Gossypium davidsonii]|nr:hypothetical protein [Gossypium davidsonii]
ADLGEFGRTDRLRPHGLRDESINLDCTFSFPLGFHFHLVYVDLLASSTTDDDNTSSAVNYGKRGGGLSLPDDGCFLFYVQVLPSPTIRTFPAQAFNWKPSSGNNQQNVKREDKSYTDFSFQTFQSSTNTNQTEQQQAWSFKEYVKDDDFSSRKNMVKSKYNQMQNFPQWPGKQNHVTGSGGDAVVGDKMKSFGADFMATTGTSNEESKLDSELRRKRKGKPFSKKAKKHSKKELKKAN